VSLGANINYIEILTIWTRLCLLDRNCVWRGLSFVVLYNRCKKYSLPLPEGCYLEKIDECCSKPVCPGFTMNIVSTDGVSSTVQVSKNLRIEPMVGGEAFKRIGNTVQTSRTARGNVLLYYFVLYYNCYYRRIRGKYKRVDLIFFILKGFTPSVIYQLIIDNTFDHLRIITHKCIHKL